MANQVPAFHVPGWIGEFRSFITRGNVVDLAVGIIVGTAFTGIVQSLVRDIFTPLIGLVLGNVDFSNIFFTLKGPHYATLAEARKAGVATVDVGLFLNAVIQFLIVALVIFWVVKLLTRMRIRSDAVAGPTPSEALLAEIRDLLAQREAATPPQTTQIV